MGKQADACELWTSLGGTNFRLNNFFTYIMIQGFRICSLQGARCVRHQQCRRTCLRWIARASLQLWKNDRMHYCSGPTYFDVTWSHFIHNALSCSYYDDDGRLIPPPKNHFKSRQAKQVSSVRQQAVTDNLDNSSSWVDSVIRISIQYPICWFQHNRLRKNRFTWCRWWPACFDNASFGLLSSWNDIWYITNIGL